MQRHLAAVWRQRFLLLTLSLIAMVTTAVATSRSPRIYQATGSLLAPKESGPSGILAGLAAAGGQGVPGFSGLGSATPNRDMLVSILRSRTMAEAVVDRFHLQERYGARYREDAVQAVQGGTRINVSREGVISIAVNDEDRKLAADIINFYLNHLDFLVAKHSTGEAGRQRVFVMEQLARAKADLEDAEEGLRRFQERNRAVVLQDQTRGAIDAAARLKGEIMAAEVQRQVLRSFATESNPDMIALERRLEEMKRQLARMQYGEESAAVRRASAGGDRRGDIYVPFARVPEVGLELARLTRQVKIQETVATILTQQIEQLRIAEAKNLPTVQILDRGEAGERPVKPKLRVNLLTSLVLSLGVGGVLAAGIDAGRARRRAEA